MCRADFLLEEVVCYTTLQTPFTVRAISGSRDNAWLFHVSTIFQTVFILYLKNGLFFPNIEGFKYCLFVLPFESSVDYILSGLI